MTTRLRTVLLATLLATLAEIGAAEDILRVGIIGLDTSHVIAFTKAMNDPQATGHLGRCRVVAAYPKGSPDIESSVVRVPMYTRQMKEMGVTIVASIDALLSQVDAVLLETNDGRPHLEQAMPCFRAGKPVFIDKPIAGSLADAVALFNAAKQHDAPMFSSSSLRYGKNSQAARDGALGKIKRCQTHSPATIEKTHPDLFWYGIHGVESLFTVLGPDCISARRAKTADGKIEVTGRWKNGAIGVFREGQGYGGAAEGSKGKGPVGAYDGYKPLVVEIARFFCTREIPVDRAETLAIYAFMEAADESKRQGGAEVTLEAVLTKARRK